MTIRVDMRNAVSRAAEALGDSVQAVKDFYRRQFLEDGGFPGRDGRSDLYYTVFGLEAALSLGIDLPYERANTYLAGFGTGESLDLVHLASLIRCRANLGIAHPAAVRADVMKYRARDGGFHGTPAAERGSVYGSFLALGIWQDLGIDCPDGDAMAESIALLRRPDGGYANEATMTASATPATAAAICVLYYLKQPVPESAVQWLLARGHPLGGFTAIPVSRASCPRFEGGLGAARRCASGSTQGVPDLLSTATALHALALLGAEKDNMRDRHLDYLDSLWSPQGGFRGHWGDEIVDCEYTYYGLLALGTLAE